ncbi:MAG: glycosyltransferase, partial [Candidatus Eremiobacteraeota bacterium]|nr:glycosyltransferase [Candidatus Eremiobacteraeota bacterium]
MPNGTWSDDAPRFVVVVPVMRLDERTTRCLEACAALSYPAKTICVVSDVPLPALSYPNLEYIATGAGTLTSPAFKRDIARTRFPDADIYANLDDDAYPPPRWLEDALRVLAEHPNVAGAGGPGLDPPDQTFWERLSSAVLQTRAGSGPLRFRFWREPSRDCDDFPSHNLFVRKQWLDAIGGWSTNWNGGEDTLLCARLANKGGLIRYDPGLGAFHYRRGFVPGHLRQMFNFGRSRGCFIRAGEQRSLRVMFAGP